MQFEPFTITLHDDGEMIEQAHVHPELTMITLKVNGVKEPALVIDTRYFLMIADAVNSAMTANVQIEARPVFGESLSNAGLGSLTGEYHGK